MTTVEDYSLTEAAPAPRSRGSLERFVANQRKRLDKGYGFWGESPASLATLKAYMVLKKDRRSAGIAKAGELLHYWLLAFPVCSTVYGVLRLLGKTVNRNPWPGGPPSLSEVHHVIRSRRAAGRIYGYTVVAPAYALGYLVAWTFQRPEHLFTALVWAVPTFIVIT